ncbi:MAG: SoxR reducing system RseC family protein [Lewinella sp.]
MIAQTPFGYTGDQAKAEVGLQLSGLTEGEFYLLGDRLEGEVMVNTLKDMVVRKITLQLDYLIRGEQETATIKAKVIDLPTPETLIGGQLYRFPVKMNYRFSRPSYKGEHLNSYWRLKVILDYDLGQYDQSFIKKVSQAFTGDPRHGTAFEVWVRNGKGTYVVAPQELPIELIEASSFLTAAFMLPFIFMVAFLAAGSVGRNFEDWLVMSLLLLVAFIGWLLLRLSTFQMTPMEIKPLRDGQLRLRILDRGNDQLKNATVGYRLLECYVVKESDNEYERKRTRFKKAFPFSEVSRQKEHLYEALLPWPIIDLPTTGKSGRVGYEWEVFIQLPNPLTGGTHEKSWPIDVSWEQFRLAPPTPEELEQEELEVLKLKELEHLPRTF